jgi:ketosteroid isomerase-like protein
VASANVKLVRSIYADWERGDYGAAKWAHPRIEYVFTDGPAPGKWKGPDGMAEAWRDFLSAWEEFRIEAHDFRELDDERILALGRWSGRGRASGLELKQMWTKGAALWQIREGKVTRLVVYFDAERALADLGLPSEARP